MVNLKSYCGEYSPFIDYCPELFKLLSDILTDKNINKELKIEICAAIAYFVLPEDIIPEKTFGAYGYIDDLYLTCHVLKNIASVKGYDYLNKYWSGKENIQDVIDLCFKETKTYLLEEEINQIFDYVGIQ